jgi:sodium transport system ATP-binding protein
LIEVKNLVKEFKQKNGEIQRAVDNLSFTAGDGESVCLLGVNGAGKTTTMRILSTVLQPTSGSARIMGYDIHEQGQKVRENLGFLSGDTGLYNRLRVIEILRYFADLYDVPRNLADNRIQEMAKMLDMESFLDKKIEFLSTGMKQKVSIVRSIIHNPPVMIFDEPTAGLDILTARNIVSFMRRSRQDGKCVLFSTHIMREAERLADRIVMIHKGKKLAEGTLEELQDISSTTDLDDVFIYFVNQVEEEEIAQHEF